MGDFLFAYLLNLSDILHHHHTLCPQDHNCLSQRSIDISDRNGCSFRAPQAGAPDTSDQISLWMKCLTLRQPAGKQRELEKHGFESIFQSVVDCIIQLVDRHDLKVRCVELQGIHENPVRICGELIAGSGCWKDLNSRVECWEQSSKNACPQQTLLTFSTWSLPCVCVCLRYPCLPHILTLYEALPVRQMLPMIFASCAVWCPSRCIPLLCIESALCLCQHLASLTPLLCCRPSSHQWIIPFILVVLH